MSRLAPLILLALAACFWPPLPDQDSLQGARRRPEPPAAPATDARIALIRVVPGTPEDTLRPPVERAVGAALGLRPDVGFDVVGAMAPRGADAAQGAALERLAPDLRAVAAAIAEAGVPSSRIVVTARVEPTARSDEVRVYLR